MTPGPDVSPSHTGCNTTEVYKGAEVIASGLYFKARTVTVRGGLLFLVGTGFDGVDVARTFFEDPTIDGRSNKNLTIRPPLVWGATRTLNIFGGTLEVATLGNDFLTSFLYYRGGVISGRFNLRVIRYMKANTTAPKLLRGGLRLVNNRRFDLVSSDLELAEGAGITNIGNISITGQRRMQIFYNLSREGWYPGRQWAEGWYVNPLCGDRCLSTPYLENTVNPPRGSWIRVFPNTTVAIRVYFMQVGSHQSHRSQYHQYHVREASVPSP
jgi:hypothetical protein